MRSNKKGFTLIELLAVIVILAVIALIATPIVLSIITKARRSAAQDSLYGVISAARTTYMETLLDGADQVTLPMWVECDGTNCLVYTATATEADGKTTYAKGTAQNYTVGSDTKQYEVVFSGTIPGKKKASGFAIDKDGKVQPNTDIDVNGFTCSINADETVKCENK